jgi:NADH dehydrogenase FAD-containing subunit
MNWREGVLTALFLAEQKKKIAIIEVLDQVLPEMEVMSLRMAFFERLNKQDVKIMTNTSLEKITEDGIVVSNNGGKKIKLNGDTVVLALGLQTNHTLYDELISLPDIDVYLIGDYLEPRKIYDAIHEGHITARNL